MTPVRCVGPRHNDDTPPPAETGHLCFECFGWLRSSLLELPAIAGWLAVHLAAGGGTTERVSGSREDPIPLRTDVLDLIGPDSLRHTVGHAVDQVGAESIRATLRYWAGRIHEQTQAPWTAWTDRNDVVGLVGWIVGHLSWLVAQPWVGELMSDVAALSRSAHMLVPWRAETMRDPDPCDRCGVRAVVLRVAESTLRCEPRMGGCGKVTVSDYLRKATG